jgi:hypothetical protein
MTTSVLDLPPPSLDSDTRYRSRKLRVAAVILCTSTVIWAVVFSMACWLLMLRLIDGTIWAHLVFQLMLWWGGMAIGVGAGYGLFSVGSETVDILALGRGKN